MTASSAPSVPQPASPGAAPKPGPRPGPKPGPPKPAVPRQATAAGAGKPAAGKPAKPGKSAPAAAPRVTLLAATADNVFDVADDAVDALLEAGAEPGSILVLTTGGAHPWQQHEETFGATQYWRQYDEGKDVFYASLPASRPLRRTTLVVVVNGFVDEATAGQTLKAALTAGASVTVCGDIERVRALTGLA
ncbi:hypothetical protein [Streptomyces sp. SID3343]|uniref:hypothetical protein n=1 Tax=Streptomyces sp. SID3343 TaxID=2690260 RepID=UPI001369E7DC|nr:hypothetical protein [Streptomyces sp. SID3343]MYV99830.1 hypothetical protein [Streptomyces sp. SID3343]